MLNAYVLARVPVCHSGHLVEHYSKVHHKVDKVTALRADVLWGDYDVISRLEGESISAILDCTKKSSVTGALILEVIDEIKIQHTEKTRGKKWRTVYLLLATDEGMKPHIAMYLKEVKKMCIDRVFEVKPKESYGQTFPLPGRDQVPVDYYIIEATVSDLDELDSEVMDRLQSKQGIIVTRTYLTVMNMKNGLASYILDRERIQLKMPIRQISAS